MLDRQTPPGELTAELGRFRQRAPMTLENRAFVEDLLHKAEVRAAPNPVLRESLAPLLALIRSSLRDGYEAESDDVAWAMAAVMYVVSPWDVSPDYLPEGLRDDELVAGWVLDHINETIVAFKEWQLPPGRRHTRPNVPQPPG